MATLKERPVGLKSPLGEDVLLLRGMTGTEQLGRLFHFDLELTCTDESVNMDKLLGGNVTVRLDLLDGKKRFFNGFVSRFAQLGRTEGGYASYQATVRPWLWFLTRRADCRIFQGKTVPEIVKAVCKEDGFTDLDEALNGSYRKWDYCVQYRETDFNFISRLLEQEGIYYFFKHEEGKHTLVLADDYGSHDPLPGYATIRYYPPSENVVRDTECVSDWSITREVVPGVVTLQDWDFEKPNVDLAARAKIKRQHEHAEYEIYDYPGEYLVDAEGKTYSRLRAEELQSAHEQSSAAGDVRGVWPGGLFSLEGHPRSDQNREYLVVSAHYELRNPEMESGAAVGARTCSSRFTAIESKTPYRSPRITPKPVIQGPQTAVVVGKSGEEIWTDKYGRVKVQFHWDRQGKRDENSSCWVRVAQVWAGKQWGAIHIPRMGQEVIVEFLEGDPDRPIITGRVYNAESMPPYGLTANATQSGLKSRSSKGGNDQNFNEIRFEDKKGEEQVFIHAEKNQDIEVENDETHWVGHDRTKKVDNDESTTIGANRTEDVGKNEQITIGENRTENVGKDESITISGGRTESVGKDESITIGASRKETVAKDESISIGANRTEDVAKKETVRIGDDRSHSVGKNDNLHVAKKLVINAGDEVTIVVGAASIVLKKDGKISIKGKDISLEGSGKINVKASGDITMKGSAIKQN